MNENRSGLDQRASERKRKSWILTHIPETEVHPDGEDSPTSKLNIPCKEEDLLRLFLSWENFWLIWCSVSYSTAFSWTFTCLGLKNKTKNIPVEGVALPRVKTKS